MENGAQTAAIHYSAPVSVHYARAFHTATVLINGTMLVTGSSNLDVAKSAELYDPSTGTWTNADNMQVNRTCHTASMLTNGNVLVTSGGLTFEVLSHTAELYNLSAGTFIDFKGMNNPTIFPQMSVIGKSNSKTFNDK